MPFSYYQAPDVNIILLVAAFVIGAFVLTFILYRLAYKIYINRVMANGRHNSKAHSPMISPGTLLLATGIVVWIATMLTIICMINMNYWVETDNANMAGQTLRSQFALLQEYEHSQITSEYSFSVGEAHADTQTVDLAVRVRTALILGKNDKLTFRIGDSKAQLKQDKDGDYVGTVQVSAWADAPSGILTLESDGEKISQILSNVPVLYKDDLGEYESLSGDAWQKFYPSMEGYVTNVGKTVDHENICIERFVTIYTHAAESDPEATFTELQLSVEQDNKVVREVDLLKDTSVSVDAEKNCYLYQFKEIVGEGMVKYYLIAKDTAGNHYRFIFCEESIDKDESNNGIDDSGCVNLGGVAIEITDKDGKTIFEE